MHDAELNKRDADELAKFITFLRVVSQAEQTGMKRIEAMVALHDDHYEEERTSEHA